MCGRAALNLGGGVGSVCHEGNSSSPPGGAENTIITFILLKPNYMFI